MPRSSRNRIDVTRKGPQHLEDGTGRKNQRMSRLTLRVLGPFARLMMPVLLALDLARIAGQEPGLAQCATQRLRGRDQRARDAVAYRVGLRRGASAVHTREDIVSVLGFGNLERLHHLHPRGVARKIVLEVALIDGNSARAGEKPDARDGGLAPPGCPDNVLLLCHRSFVLFGDCLRLLRGMRMLRTRVYLQLVIEAPSEAILRQHSA